MTAASDSNLRSLLKVAAPASLISRVNAVISLPPSVPLNMISALDNRVQTMNNDLVKIDALMSYALNVKPNVDRIAANEGKEDARRD